MRRRENILYGVKRDIIKVESGEQERGGGSGFSVFSCSPHINAPGPLN